VTDQDRRLRQGLAKHGDIRGVVGHGDADHRIGFLALGVAAQVRGDHLMAGGLEGRAETLEGPAAAEGAVNHHDGGHRILITDAMRTLVCQPVRQSPP